VGLSEKSVVRDIGNRYLFDHSELFVNGRGDRCLRECYREGLVLPDLGILLRLAVGIRQVLERSGTVYVAESRFGTASDSYNFGNAPLPACIAQRDLDATDTNLVLASLNLLRDQYFFSTYAEVKGISTPELKRRDALWGGRENSGFYYGTEPAAGSSLSVLHPNELNLYIWAVLYLVALKAPTFSEEMRANDKTLLRAGMVWARWVFWKCFAQWSSGERPVGWKLINMIAQTGTFQFGYDPTDHHPLLCWDPWIDGMYVSTEPTKEKLKRYHDELDSHEGEALQLLRQCMRQAYNITHASIIKQQKEEGVVLDRLEYILGLDSTQEFVLEEPQQPLPELDDLVQMCEECKEE
jgi:hypothetical protein